MADLSRTLNYFFTKKGYLEDDWSYYMVNRFISMDSKYQSVSFLVNKYLYFCNPRILKALFYFFLPKSQKAPFLQYIKSKKEKESEYKEVLDKLAKYYNWSDKERGCYADYFIKLFEDKMQLEKYKLFLGVE